MFMKKFLFLMLSAAIAVSALAGLTTTSMQKTVKAKTTAKSKIEQVMLRGKGVITPTASFQFNGWDQQASHILRAGDPIVWDFESESEFNEWQAIDADGDGYNWFYLNNTGLETGRMDAYSGEGVVYSESFHNNEDGQGGVALFPDNWLVSPQVTLGGALTFYAAAQDASWADEVFGVYVCVGTPTDFTDFVQVGQDFTATGEYVKYEFDLSQFQGQVGCFAIVHHNCTDMFILKVDLITLDPSAVVLPYPTVPTNLTVTPAATTADVAWDNDGAASNWNLRYRPFTEGEGENMSITLPIPGYEVEIADCAILDADGDGYSWGLMYSDDTQTDGQFYSESYHSGALTPDNWLIMPLFKLQGVLRFKAWNYYNYYPEKLEVMVGMADAIEDNTVYTDLFTTIWQKELDTEEPFEYEIDLSEYNGEMGYIVFRHYGTTDMWEMYLDDIFIGTEGPEPAPWVNVEGLTEPNYTITGLTPETTYEVQVMGYNEAHESNWCDIVKFTTTPEAPVIPDVYILGEVNEQNWAPNAGTMMAYDEETGLYTATVTLDGRNDGFNYFSFTNVLAEYDDQGSWDYIAPYRFGAVADGDFEVFDEHFGTELALTYDGGKAYKLAAGEYKLTVNLATMKLIIEKIGVEPQILLGDVNSDGFVTIADATLLIDYLLGANVTINEDNSDVETNGTISIGDVTALIDMLLNAN